MARVIVANWDDMVFADRNKEFGAYALRKSYPKTLMIGTITISLLVLLISYGPLYAKRMGWIGVETERTTQAVTTIEIDLPPVNPEIEEPVVPPTPPPVEPPAVAMVEFLTPEPVPEGDQDENQTMQTVDQLAEAPNFGAETVEGENTIIFDDVIGTGEVPDVIVDTSPGPSDFVSVEQEPVPVNIGDIKSLIGYPQLARDAQIQGTIVARILVDKFGNYEKHIVTRDAHPLIQDEVEKHLSKLKFTPAIQGGRPIKFWVNVPFKFTLLQ